MSLGGVKVVAVSKIELAKSHGQSRVSRAVALSSLQSLLGLLQAHPWTWNEPVALNFGASIRRNANTCRFA